MELLDHARWHELVQRKLDESLSAHEQLELDRHLSECLKCQRYMEQVGVVDHILIHTWSAERVPSSSIDVEQLLAGSPRMKRKGRRTPRMIAFVSLVASIILVVYASPTFIDKHQSELAMSKLNLSVDQKHEEDRMMADPTLSEAVLVKVLSPDQRWQASIDQANRLIVRNVATDELVYTSDAFAQLNIERWHDNNVIVLNVTYANGREGIATFHVEEGLWQDEYDAQVEGGL